MSTTKNNPLDSHKVILKSTSILSFGTLVSRILGFVRDILIARLLGTAALADAFFVAFRLPNMFREMVGEGAANSALVPVLSEHAHKYDKKHLNEFISVIFVWAVFILGAISLSGVILAPVIVRVIAPGFTDDPAKLEETVRLTRIMFPYLLFIGLTAYSMALLFIMRSFTVAAFSSCLLNIAIIAAALIGARFSSYPVYVLSAGVLVGGLAQLFYQWIPLKKMGFHWQRPQTLNHAGVRQIGKLLVPRLWGNAVYQSNVFIDTFCASLSGIVGMGGISAIYYSSRIIQFPLGVFGVSLVSASLPTLSGHASRQDYEALKKTLLFSLKNIIFCLLPSTIFLMALATPIIRILFERGEFDEYSTVITAWVLTCNAIGLTAFGASKVLVSAFHALQDTKTPVKIAGFSLILNIVLNFALMFPFKIGGIALASSLVGFFNFFMLTKILNKRLPGIGDEVVYFFGKLIVPCALMAAGIILTWMMLSSYGEILRLIISSCVGAGLFLAGCWMVRVEQAVKVAKWLSRN